MIELVNEDVDSRLVQYLIQAPVNDGGQWDMVRYLNVFVNRFSFDVLILQ